MFAAYISQHTEKNSLTEENIGWSGWDAALIKSKHRKAKQKIPPNDYDQKPLDEDVVENTKKMRFEGANTAECTSVDGVELSVPKMKPRYKRGKAHREALPYSLWPRAVSDERCQVVAYATELVKARIKWGAVQKLLLPHMYEKLQADVSSSITKFVLSIFDMEDFAIGSRTKTREFAWRRLLKELQTFFHPAEKCDFLNQEMFVKNQRDAMKAMAEGEDKGVPYRCFEGLYEQDVVYMLMYHVRPTVDAKTVSAGGSFYLEPRDGSVPDHVLAAMKRYVPLKGDSKMQLTLELSRRKCYRILDYLFVEVCKGFLSDELFKALDEGLQETSVTASSVLSKLVSEVQHGIHELATFKSKMIHYSQSCATFPLREGPFGVFTDEVIEVVKIADHERRAEGHRFIGVHDILFGLYHSRVGNHELVSSRYSNSSPLDSPEMPPYEIYKLAGKYSKLCGSENAVELEHLVLAVIAVIEGKTYTSSEATTLQNCLRKMNTLPPVQGWKDDAVEYCSKPITECESLVQAIIKEGLSLPDFRLEH